MKIVEMGSGVGMQDPWGSVPTSEKQSTVHFPSRRMQLTSSHTASVRIGYQHQSSNGLGPGASGGAKLVP